MDFVLVKWAWILLKSEFSSFLKPYHCTHHQLRHKMKRTHLSRSGTAAILAFALALCARAEDVKPVQPGGKLPGNVAIKLVKRPTKWWSPSTWTLPRTAPTVLSLASGPVLSV